MKFTAEANWAGQPATLVWEDGVLTGTPPDAARDVLVFIGQQPDVTLPGIAAGRADLADPRLTEAAIREVLQDVRVTESNVPTPKIPAGTDPG